MGPNSQGLPHGGPLRELADGDKGDGWDGAIQDAQQGCRGPTAQQGRRDVSVKNAQAHTLARQVDQELLAHLVRPERIPARQLLQRPERPNTDAAG